MPALIRSQLVLGSREHPVSVGAGEDLEDRVYEVFSDLPAEERVPALAALGEANPVHAAAIRALAQRMASGEAMLSGVAFEEPEYEQSMASR